jgi:hypothetical protein
MPWCAYVTGLICIVLHFPFVFMACVCVILLGIIDRAAFIGR